MFFVRISRSSVEILNEKNHIKLLIPTAFHQLDNIKVRNTELQKFKKFS